MLLHFLIRLVLPWVQPEMGFLIGSNHYCCGSVARLCLTLWNSKDWSSPGFPVLHYLPEFAQTHVHSVGDAIQSPHLLSSPFPPALNLSHHQSFPVSQFFASGGQNIGASASPSAFSMIIQGWFPLGNSYLLYMPPAVSTCTRYSVWYM